MNMGLLHSIETFGAVDGPGIRTVFFLLIAIIRTPGALAADTALRLVKLLPVQRGEFRTMEKTAA